MWSPSNHLFAFSQSIKNDYINWVGSKSGVLGKLLRIGVYFAKGSLVGVIRCQVIECSNQHSDSGSTDIAHDDLQIDELRTQ